MASERMRSRCRERIGRLCDAGLDSEELRVEAIAELRRAIGFSRWCWPEADPDSLLPIGAVHETELGPALPRMFVLEQTGDVNAKHVLARSRYGSAAMSAATGGDLARSTRWDQCLRACGVGDMLVSACRDAHGCWGWVELMREDDDPVFDTDDVRLVEDLASDLGSALRRASVRAIEPSGDDLPGPAVVIVDERLRSVSWTAPAGAWLQLVPAAHESQELPLLFYPIVGRLLAGPRTPASQLPARMRFRTAAGRWATVDGAALEGVDAGRMAITIRVTSPEETVDLHCRAHGLTARERQLVSLVLTGLSTRQLAEELSISSYTVKDHLKAVFDKVGVRSRRELVAGILGHSSDPEPAAA
jgi:DNA-binding CsgD family transcriptional regulator